MVHRFGVFEFDDENKELRKNGRTVAIEPQPAKALALLLARASDLGGARAGEIVSREELREVVWGKDTHVDFDRGLAYCVSQIRAALGDSGDNPRFVQTIPKQGFKFIAPLTTSPSQVPGPEPQVRSGRAAYWVAAAAVLVIGVGLALAALQNESPRIVIGVSIFDNETGNADYDRPVAALSDLVVEHLTKLDPNRIAVVGNAAILRQPRNIRNLKAVRQELKADYVLLGQLQQGETGLRFITHFIRLSDEAHLKANRLPVSDPSLAGLEAAVVEEFERAVREHVLNPRTN
jgi:DNA-binding winged helix-turn-helix (wHTH) protein/TolB-like protein